MAETMPDISQKVQERKKRWEQFYDLNSSVRFLLKVNYAAEKPERPFPRRDNIPARIEWAWKDYLRQLEQVSWLEDDTIPYLNVFTGTEIFAEAFGCKVHYADDNMPFALPLVQTAAEAEKITIPDYGSTHLADLFYIADELRSRAGNDAVLALVDIQSPMDIAALIWDKNTLYPALIETPEAVLELANKVKVLWFRFLDDWKARYGDPFIAHYPDYYMPYGITLSEDEVGSVNSKMFIEYYLPELVEISEHFGCIGIHCCANARHQWRNFLKIPNLKLLNLVQPKSVIQEAMQFFAPHVAQWHTERLSTLEPGPEKYPAGIHLILDPAAETRQGAIQKAEYFHKFYL